MSRNNVLPRRPLLAAVLLAAAPGLPGQTAVTPNDPDLNESTVELSPFLVEAGEDADSYRASATLAGTRIRTDLKDIASSISVVTRQFLQDTGAVNNESLLQYTTNTEVGGSWGNFSGVGGGFRYKEINHLRRPMNNNVWRGVAVVVDTRE